ncbi:hypothetical protein PAPYR_13063 [Paratrimastix pyriformis]|uniref:Uncharacterized protein n=1 Tax=Paratrimastix pyriformis TaxID=342808 RepID=A0ABQ8U5W2_9EUKA|nr:hypothetical protein PAPYR_13063 [Paratrimastix pyriformis]
MSYYKLPHFFFHVQSSDVQSTAALYAAHACAETAPHYVAHLDALAALCARVEELPDWRVVGPLAVGACGLRGWMRDEAMRWMEECRAGMMERLKTAHGSLAQRLLALRAALQQPLTEITSLRMVLEALTQFPIGLPSHLGTLFFGSDRVIAAVRTCQAFGIPFCLSSPLRDPGLEMEIMTLGDQCDLLESSGVTIPADDPASMPAVLEIWRTTSQCAQEVSSSLHRSHPSLQRAFEADRELFVTSAHGVRQSFLESGLAAPTGCPQVADVASVLGRFLTERDEMEHRRDGIHQGEALFGLPLTALPDLDALSADLSRLQPFHALAGMFRCSKRHCESVPFLGPRHWARLRALAALPAPGEGAETGPPPDGTWLAGLRIGTLLDSKLPDHPCAIHRLIALARHQRLVADTMSDLEAEWGAVRLEMMNSGQILGRPKVDFD